jgi:hypothetical protein
MLTQDQIPLVRLAARRALEQGKIDLQHFNKVIRALNDMETENRKYEDKKNQQIVNSLNKALTYA